MENAPNFANFFALFPFQLVVCKIEMVMLMIIDVFESFEILLLLLMTFSTIEQI